jgi:mannose-6-phosphate isomerase-like protein (cupin superfamily)
LIPQRGSSGTDLASETSSEPGLSRHLALVARLRAVADRHDTSPRSTQEPEDAERLEGQGLRWRDTPCEVAEAVEIPFTSLPDDTALEAAASGPHGTCNGMNDSKTNTGARRGGSMVKISDKTNYSRFVRPGDEDEGIWLDYVEVHLVTHPVGQVKEMHVHDPPQDHVVTIRSGRMRWTVGGVSLDAGPGDVIVTPAGTPHSYEVLGDEPARVVCVDSPVRPMSE